MSQLRVLQEDFLAYLLGLAPKQGIENRLRDDDRIGANQRLRIYHDSYRLRLREALSNAYPKLHMLLGDELFDRIAYSYIEAFPSEYRNLRWYGDSLSDHLADTLPQHPVAAEMAAFEWTLSLTFDGNDAPVLALADLAGIAPEAWSDLCFDLQPCLHFLPLRWNTVAIWNALDAEQPPPAFQQRSAFETWLIWRCNFDAHFRSLEAIEERALHLALDGADFGHICASLNAQCQFAAADGQLAEQESIVRAAQYLAAWLQDGMIAGINTAIFEQQSAA